jgi:hypothetical protein
VRATQAVLGHEALQAVDDPPMTSRCCRHLQHVLAEFVDHYNRHRPHRALALAPPEPRHPPPTRTSPPAAAIRRHDRLGGLIHEYTIAA